MTTGMSPSGGARRSRRGYYFQDLCATRMCCEMLGGGWTHITLDGIEDVTCEDSADGSKHYVQVKTDEHPSGPWTVARLSGPQRPGDPGTSILGRLFGGKPLPDATTFRLQLNAPVAPELECFEVGSVVDRSSTTDSLSRRLTGIPLEDHRSIPWCLERLTLELVAADADGLEAILIRELGIALMGRRLPLLPQEMELVLEGVVAFVQGRSRPLSVLPVTRAEFESELDRRANDAMRGTATAQGPRAPTLGEKLEAAGLDAAQIAPLHDRHFAFTREYRSALPDRVALLDELVERIRMRCVALSLQLREGAIQPGAEMFSQTEAVVREAWEAGGFERRGIGILLAYGALHDITARCQHRYDS